MDRFLERREDGQPGIQRDLCSDTQTPPHLPTERLNLPTER